MSRTRSSARAARSVAGVITTAVVSGALLVATAFLGLHLPRTGRLPGFGEPGHLAAGRGLDSLPHLSNDYVSQVLGTDTATTPASPGKAPRPVLAQPAKLPVPRATASTPSPLGPIGLGTPGRADVANDAFSAARTVTTLPFADGGGDAASTEPGEPATCPGGDKSITPRGGTAWWSFTPRTTVDLVADSYGSGAPSSVAAYTGTAGNLTLVACDATPAGGQIQLTAITRTPYYFQVHATGAHAVLHLGLLGTLRDVTPGPSGGGLAGTAYDPVLSADGRTLAFESNSRTLTANVNPHCVSAADEPDIVEAEYGGQCANVFVRDIATGRTTLVSVEPTGTSPGYGNSYRPAISRDGTVVAFVSTAIGLAPDSLSLTGLVPSVYVRDLKTGVTTHVSAPSLLRQAHNLGDPTDRLPFINVSLSPNGRYVAYTAEAFDTGKALDFTHCVPQALSRTIDSYYPGHPALPTIDYPSMGGTCGEVWLYDRVTGRQREVTTSIHGGGSNEALVIVNSVTDGGEVVFSSDGADLVAGDTNDLPDVFAGLPDGHIVLVSQTPSGAPGNGTSVNWAPQAGASDDGRFVAFSSTASNLVAGDTNGLRDSFVRDLKTGRTVRVSVASDGRQGTVRPGLLLDNDQYEPSVTLSADGSRVAFESAAWDLVDEDNNGELCDTFVHDLLTGTTRIASQRDDGWQHTGFLTGGSFISPDGLSVVFTAIDADGHADDSNYFVTIYRKELG
ncbi:MAG TPA: hypothetical protein VHE83_06665 [Mycobacteriales bacterium]|nr:hypothetical protein [Mycobacteriales bacterium]